MLSDWSWSTMLKSRAVGQGLPSRAVPSFGIDSRPALTALARSRYLTRLRALDLGCNILVDAGVRSLVTSPVVTNLTALFLYETRVGTPAAVWRVGSGLMNMLYQA